MKTFILLILLVLPLNARADDSKAADSKDTKESKTDSNSGETKKNEGFFEGDVSSNGFFTDDQAGIPVKNSGASGPTTQNGYTTSSRSGQVGGTAPWYPSSSGAHILLPPGVRGRGGVNINIGGSGGSGLLGGLGALGRGDSAYRYGAPPPPAEPTVAPFHVGGDSFDVGN